LIRTSTLFSLIIVACLGFALFKVKYEVQALEDDLGRINRQINADNEAIHVLKAEWSYLSQPTRVGELARRHLPLAPLTAAQLGSLDTLPLRIDPPQNTAVATPAVPTGTRQPHVIAVKAGGLP
jgi:cell division protein FtsL